MKKFTFSEFTDLAKRALSSNVISVNKKYAISYPGTSIVCPDDSVLLTDNEKSSENIMGKGWCSVYIDNSDGKYIEKVPHFYISVDLGYECEVDALTINFGQNEEMNCKIPIRVEALYSDDGFVYEFLSDMNKGRISNNRCEFTLSLLNDHFKAKSIRFVVYTDENVYAAMDELKVYGKEITEYKLLFEKDSDTTFECKNDTANFVETTKIECAKWNVFEVTTKAADSSFTQYYDLNGLFNISEVAVDFMQDENTAMPMAISVMTSEDGIEYTEFTNGYAYNKCFKDGKWYANYRAYKNYTQKAAFVKIKVIANSKIAMGKIWVFGADFEITAPECKYKTVNIPAYTNVAENKKAYIGAVAEENAVTTLTDSLYPGASLRDPRWTKVIKPNVNITRKTSTNDIKTSRVIIDLEEEYSEICSVMLEYKSSITDLYNEIFDIEISDDGINFKKIAQMQKMHVINSKKIMNAEFEKVKTRYVAVNIHTTDIVFISQILVFDKVPHRPFIRGGFMQLHMLKEDYPYYSSFVHFSKDEWYKEFKMMKQAGMEYCVIQFGADYLSKLSTYPNPSMPDFVQAHGDIAGYGTADPIEAVLEAADRLDMKVFLGSVISYNYPVVLKKRIEDRYELFDKIIECGNKIVDDLKEKYSHHKSFYAMYLADETCDEWMDISEGQGWKDYRYFYSRQSKHIREVMPDKKIMISPAIWRSTTSEVFARNMRNMVEMDNGEKMFDMISIQDCLGREHMNDGVYEHFEDCLQLVAKEIRAMGIEFWNDTEVFLPACNGPKNFRETIDAINVEAKYSNCSIVFDIPHYFDPQSINHDEYSSLDKGYVSREYLRYYQNYFEKYKK